MELPSTIADFYQALKSQLLPVTASPEQADAEAAMLFEELFQYAPSVRFSEPERPVPASIRTRLDALLIDRLERRIPVQYLLHRAWFYGLPLYVNPNVLIPRPDTEHAVEAVLAFLENSDSGKPLHILDVGTGSGAIALALAHKLRDKAHIKAVDASPDALAVARLNARSLKLDVGFLEAGDLFAPLQPTPGPQPAPTARFDVIVSNPPYIDPALKGTLSPEVLWHEPQSALFPPSDDATWFYRRLAREGKTYLQPGGALIVEIGAGMGAHVESIFVEAGYQQPRITRDYAGHDRVVQAVLPNG